MSIKNELEKIEKSLDPKDDDLKISVRVNWRDDDLYEWHLEDGSIELIKRDEFERRGGIVVEWPDDENL